LKLQLLAAFISFEHNGEVPPLEIFWNYFDVFDVEFRWFAISSNPPEFRIAGCGVVCGVP
jgi:hypothetical protein